MFDLGWSELLIIAVVAIIVVGPKDLPKMLRTVGRFVGQMKRMANDFTRQFEDAVRDSELDEVNRQIKAASSSADFDNPLKDVEDSVKDAMEPVNGVAERARSAMSDGADTSGSKASSSSAGASDEKSAAGVNGSSNGATESAGAASESADRGTSGSSSEPSTAAGRGTIAQRAEKAWKSAASDDA